MTRGGWGLHNGRIGGERGVVIGAISLSIDTSNSGRFFFAIRPHIIVHMIRLLLLAIPLLIAKLLRSLGNLFGNGRLIIADGVPKRARWCLVARSLRGIAQRLPIRPLAAEDGGFVVFPIAFAELEAAVLSPEEEPDAGENEAGRKNAEKCQDAFVVDAEGIDRAGSRGELRFAVTASRQDAVGG